MPMLVSVLLQLLGATAVVLGVLVLFGLGWALIAGGTAVLAAAAGWEATILRKGH